MQTRTLGSSLEVSAPGVGCMNIAWACGPGIKKEDAIRLFYPAYDVGASFGTSSAGTHGNSPLRTNQ